MMEINKHKELLGGWIRNGECWFDAYTLTLLVSYIEEANYQSMKDLIKDIEKMSYIGPNVHSSTFDETKNSIIKLINGKI